MRKCAAALADSRLPVALLTKSSLVRRDIDLWDRVHRTSSFILNLSISTLSSAAGFRCMTKFISSSSTWRRCMPRGACRSER